MSGRVFAGQLEPRFNPFHPEDYLGEILRVTVLAWTKMKRSRSNEIEDRITFALAGRLANDPNFSDLPFDVAAQHWLIDIDGKPLGRLDLRFKHRSSQRDYFAFEAKRLHVTYPGGDFKSEYPKYVGQDGMMAFVNRYYSRGLPVAGMLGYVMDGQSDRAWMGLKDRIEHQRARLRLTGGSGLVESELSHMTGHAVKGILLGETAHDCEACRLRLFHLLPPVQGDD